MIEKPILYNKPEIDDLVKGGYDVVLGPVVIGGHQHSQQDIEDEIQRYVGSKRFDTIVVYQRAYPSNGEHKPLSVSAPVQPVKKENCLVSIIFALKKETKKPEPEKQK